MLYWQENDIRDQLFKRVPGKCGHSHPTVICRLALERQDMAHMEVTIHIHICE